MRTTLSGTVLLVLAGVHCAPSDDRDRDARADAAREAAASVDAGHDADDGDVAWHSDASRDGRDTEALDAARDAAAEAAADVSRDGATDGSPDGGGDAASDAAFDGSRDAGPTDARPDVDPAACLVLDAGAGRCNALVVDPAPVQEVWVAERSPAWTGGQIPNGRYVMTGYYRYTGPGGPAGPTTRRGTGTFQFDGHCFQATVSSLDGNLHAAGAYFMGRNYIGFTSACAVPPTGSSAPSYSVRGDELWIEINGPVVWVFTRR